MPTITARVLQSTGLAASIGAIAARELGLTSDTERPVIGTTTGGAKYIGTEEVVNITTVAPAALTVRRRSKTIIFVDTATAGGHVALDIQAGASVAGYRCKVFVSGPDARVGAVTYGGGLVEYIPNGYSQEFIWNGSAWLKTTLSYAEKAEIGQVVDTMIETAYDAKHPFLKLWDADHDLTTANYPLAIAPLRAQKSPIWGGSAYVTSIAVTVTGGVITSAAGTRWTNFMAAIAEEQIVHGSYVNFRCVTLNGNDYAITNVNTVTPSLTIGSPPGDGAYTLEYYPNRIPGSTSSARTFKDTGRVLMSPNGVAYVPGARRRDRMQGHWHEVYESGNNTYAAYNASGRSTGTESWIPTATPASTRVRARELITDGTNGTPRTGANTEPNSTTVYRAMWVGTIL